MPKKADTKKSTARETASKKLSSKKVSTKKEASKKTSVKKTPQKKAFAKKSPAKKTRVKKAPAKKSPAKKAPVKKSHAKKALVKKSSVKKRTSPISSYKGRKGEKYMSAAMKKHFNAVLIDWREHLKEEMQKTFDHLKNKGESYADPIDRASQEEEFAFELRTRDRERKLVNKIAASLEQIKQDDYGYCYACGIEIGVKRLEARPTATHCIDCKTLDEIKEKQLGG